MTRNVFIGFDQRENIAYAVARASILQRTSAHVCVLPLKLKNLPMLTRPIEQKDGKMWCPISQAPMATEFAISRFVVPFLQRDGLALFVDCDIVALADIDELFQCFDGKSAIQVVKHNQESGAATKMDGQVQTYYSRKNWSSVMLWNLDHPAHKNLTLEALNTWPGRDLHAFKWLKDEEIGELPPEWNVLVGIEVNPSAKLLHLTLGGPWIKGWKRSPCDDIWRAAKALL